jgi:hypothetical protein
MAAAAQSATFVIPERAQRLSGTQGQPARARNWTPLRVGLIRRPRHIPSVIPVRVNAIQSSANSEPRGTVDAGNKCRGDDVE